MPTDSIRDQLQSALTGRYAIERELGRGGMATVYLARDLKHDRDLAIKVLDPELAATVGSERFHREIQYAGRLQHPNILGLIDSGDAGGQLYYVMPFVAGESLRHRLDRERMLPVDTALQFTREVADALGYAHERGIVHRDIKPENILISGGHALVADFGIARAVSEAGDAAKLTQTGIALGTPLYMSPEQALGEPVNATSDLYALGCVAYEMLAGHPPFGGTTAQQILARHAMEQVPRLQLVRDTVPDEVEDAIMTALSKSSADRPQSAAQFMDLLSGTTVSSTAARTRGTGTRGRRTGVPLVRAWSRSAAIGVGLALMIAVAAIARFVGQRAPATAGEPADAALRRQIAVLYFADNSPRRDLGFVADGLTEELIVALRAVNNLSVVSTGGVAQFRAGAPARDSIARALQVGTVIQGSVEPRDAGLRVTVKMFDERGSELDKTTIDGSGKDLVALSRNLAEQSAALIRRRVGIEVQLGQTRAGTQLTDAWAMYRSALARQARGDSSYRSGDRSAFVREYLAADSLAAATENLDPKWIAPLVLRGNLQLLRSRRIIDDLGVVARSIDAGLEHARRALTLAPNDADALELRGTLLYWRWLNQLETDPTKATTLLAAARADLEHATEINPAQASAFASLSHLYFNVSDKSIVDVIVTATQAMEKDAYLSNADVLLYRLILASYDGAQFPSADRWCREGRRRFPKDSRFVECALLLMSSKLGEPDVPRAWRLADSVVALTPDPTDRRYRALYDRALVAAVLARAGLADSGRRVLRATMTDPELDPTRDVSLVSAFAWVLVGDTAQAVNLLKDYLAVNPNRRATYREDPGWWFRPIASDPRYKAVVGAPR